MGRFLVRSRGLVAHVVVVAVLGLVGVDGAGAAPLGLNVISTPDTAGAVGSYASMVLDAEGNPVVSYYDTTHRDLKVLHCTNPDCSGSQTPQSPDRAGRVGEHTSIVLDAAGNPVVSYYDDTNDDLKVLHCTNPDCSGTQTPQSPDTAGNVGEYTSIVLDQAGNPVVSYFDGGLDADLKVLHCTNPDCSGTQTPRSPDTAGNVGRFTSIVLDAAGNPVVSYHDRTNEDLRVLHCTNPDCSGTQTPQSPDTAGFVGRFTSIVLDAAGNPVVSYSKLANSDERIGPVGTKDLRVLHCTNPDCSGTQTPQSPDTAATGVGTSIVLDAAGNPVVSYGTNRDFKVLHCTNPDCSGTQSAQFPDTGGWASTSLALDASGNPVVAYRTLVDGDLKVLHCINADCSGCSASEGANVIMGTSGDDTLTGTAGGDVILGRGGNDTIVGRGGRDCIMAGAGDDTVNGGSDRDFIYGGTGSDNLRGGNGNDRLYGGRGHDTVYGGRGHDTVYGGHGNDTLYGRTGDDMLSGGIGRDTLRGGKGTDTCSGGRGIDTEFSC